MGLASAHRKTILAAEMLKTENTKNSSLEEEGSSSRRPKPLRNKSRKNTDATGLSTVLLTKQINMGTWNVRTMYQTGKTAQVAAEMTRYKLTLLGISETRWAQAGQRRISTGELLLFSGHEEENALHTE